MELDKLAIVQDVYSFTSKAGTDYDKYVLKIGDDGVIEVFQKHEYKQIGLPVLQVGDIIIAKIKVQFSIIDTRAGGKMRNYDSYLSWYALVGRVEPDYSAWKDTKTYTKWFGKENKQQALYDDAERLARANIDAQAVEETPQPLPDWMNHLDEE